MLEKKVEMGELVCSTDSNTTLVSSGITTCIAIALNGAYEDDDYDSIHFCALYHWAGFHSGEQDPKGKVETELENVIKGIREHLDISAEDDVTINRLVFIGGEKSNMASTRFQEQSLK